MITVLSSLPRVAGLPKITPESIMHIHEDTYAPYTLDQDLWSQLVLIGFGIAMLLTIFAGSYFWFVGVLGTRLQNDPSEGRVPIEHVACTKQ